MEILRQNASAVFAVVGVLLGGVLTFAANWRLRKRDYDLRAWERLLDRRVAAHEDVSEIALQMRAVVALGELDAEGEVLRYPAFLQSREVFEEWFAASTTKVAACSPWLTTEATREANYLQDYLLTLHQNTLGVPVGAFPRVGVIVREDFIALSGSLERAAYAFFQSTRVGACPICSGMLSSRSGGGGTQ